MNIGRFVMIAVPVGVVLAYFLMQSLTLGENSNREMIARGELMQEVKRRSFVDVYETIEAGFPEDYAAHVDDIRDIGLDTDLSSFELGSELLEESDTFIAELRRRNTEYLATAGREPLLNIQRAKLAVLKDASDRPDLCARVATNGLHNLDRIALSKLDRGIYGRWLNATFEAMVAGRDSPETFEAPSEQDWQIFLRGWVKAQGGKTPGMEAFVARDESEAEVTCDGAMEFTRQLIADTTPSGLRVLVDYTSKVVR